GAVRNGVGSRETLKQALGRRSLSGLFSESILHDAVLSPRALHGAAKLRVLRHGDALESSQNHRGHLGQVALQLFDFFLFLAAFFHPNISRTQAAVAMAVSASARSMAMPGPIVEVKVIFLT